MNEQLSTGCWELHGTARIDACNPHTRRMQTAPVDGHNIRGNRPWPRDFKGPAPSTGSILINSVVTLKQRFSTWGGRIGQI